MISTILTSSTSHRGPVSLPRTGSSEWLIALSCLKLITVLKPFTIEELEETDSPDRNSWGWVLWLNMFVWFFHYLANGRTLVTCHCCVTFFVWPYLSLACHFEPSLCGYCKQCRGEHTATHLSVSIYMKIHFCRSLMLFRAWEGWANGSDVWLRQAGQCTFRLLVSTVKWVPKSLGQG